MSLINDALKQVSRAKTTAPPGAAGTPPLRPVDTPPKGSGGAKVFAGLLCVILAIALSFLFRGFAGVRKKTSPASGLTVTAREDSQPSPETGPSESTPHSDSAPVTNTVSTASARVPSAASPAQPSELSVTSTQRVASAVPEPPPPPPPPFPSLKLQGIFYKPGDGSAMINSRMVRVGDRVQRARVLAIEREIVSLEWYGETNVLTLR